VNRIASLYAMASTRLNQIRAHRGSGTTGFSALLVAFQLVMLVLFLTGQIR
jgi:hypothetical protein